MADFRLGSMVAEDSGSGPAVVMIHGLGGSSNTFEPQMPELQGMRVLRPDLPGAGRSPYQPGTPSLDAMASSVWDVVRAAGLSKVHLVGHSMGTLLCQYLAVRHPDAVRSLVLYGAILEPPDAARRALKERAAVARRDGMAGIASAVAGASLSQKSRASNPATIAFVRESLMRQDPAGYAAHCTALSEASAAQHGEIRCPTLIVAGSDDPVAPVRMGQTLLSRLSDGIMETLPGIGHWMTLEAAQESGKLLREHLKSLA